MAKIFIIIGDSSNTISKEIQKVYEHDYTINIMKNDSKDKADGKRLAKMTTIPSWKSSNLIEKINYRTTELSPFDMVIVGYWKSTLHALDLYSTYKLNPNTSFIFVKNTESEIFNSNEREWHTFVEGKITELTEANNIQLTFEPTNTTSPVFTSNVTTHALELAPVITTSTLQIAILNCGQ